MFRKHALNRWLGRHGAEVLAPKFKEEARQRAMELEPVITELKDQGLSLAKIAGELNKRKVATPRGGKWDHSSVGNVLQRLRIVKSQDIGFQAGMIRR